MKLHHSYRVLWLSIVGILAWLGAFAASANAAEAARRLYSDSRATFAHRIPIYDEDQRAIDPAKDNAAKTLVKPFSEVGTCGKCHDYNAVSRGWHFNSVDSVSPGRPGEPWIYYDATTRTQLPLSYRPWPGAYKPSEVGMGDWDFVKTFGRHMPGGGVGERHADRKADPQSRWHIGGNFNVDCMICHSADDTHDPGARIDQFKAGNIKWIPGMALGLGKIKGTPSTVIEMDLEWSWAEAAKPNSDLDPGPKLVYDVGRFEGGTELSLPVTRRPPAERCYFCHTTQDSVDRNQLWHSDRDVHIQAGLVCVDCHRNGIDHNIVRGYENEGAERKDPAIAALSCSGCHMGVESAPLTEMTLGGRLGAPRPVHKGLPPIHFEKLTCTACHSGNWPESSPTPIQTSLAHGLGIHSQTREPTTPPRILAPVFLREAGADGQHTGKIAPHKVIWPNFWGRLEGEKVTPIPTNKVKAAAKEALPPVPESSPVAAAPLTNDQVEKTLTALAGQKDPGEPVYISGGRMYRLSGGKLTSAETAVAEPYAWPLAHDVRPAKQALGSRGCTDCHSMSGPLYFGEVTAAGPVAPEAAVKQTMLAMRGDSGALVTLFALSFQVRTLLKVVSFATAAILAAVLLVYVVRAVGALMARTEHN